MECSGILSKDDNRVQCLDYLGSITAYYRKHNLYIDDVCFEEDSQVYDTILILPMRGSNLKKMIF